MIKTIVSNRPQNTELSIEYIGQFNNRVDLIHIELSIVQCINYGDECGVFRPQNSARGYRQQTRFKF